VLIDDRLRVSLHWEPDQAPPADPGVHDAIVHRAMRRRRNRFVAVATATAAAALVVAVAAPWAISHYKLGGEPVQRPTPSPHWTPKNIAPSPLDDHWEGSSGDRSERLAALDGTGLDEYGQAIYSGYIARTTTDLQFGNGAVTLSTSAMGGRFLGGHANKALLHGTYTVRGHTVAMRFDELGGTTVFHWSRVDDGVGERLELTFIRTSARGLYGAPAEVFFRMWSAQPFWIWGCC